MLSVKLTAAAIVSALLSAGAAQSALVDAAPADQSRQQNETVIYKTDPHWPVRGLMTTDPCKVRGCVEA